MDPNELGYIPRVGATRWVALLSRARHRLAPTKSVITTDISWNPSAKAGVSLQRRSDRLSRLQGASAPACPQQAGAGLHSGRVPPSGLIYLTRS